MFDSAVLREVLSVLTTAAPTEDDAERIDRIALLEDLKCAAAAAQADETAAFVAAQRAEQAAAGVPAERVGRGIAAQVGLARRVSPFSAARYVGWAMVLTGELPGTLAALRHGRVNEWRAMIVARETIWLSREHRAVVDAELAPRLQRWGDRRVESEVKKLAYRLDPHGFVARIRGAEGDRRVGIRPAPDTMCRLTGLLPAAQGVAAYAALRRHADSVISAGDGRSRGQIMADTLVERVTGQSAAGDVAVEINLIMTDDALFGAATENSSAADDDTQRSGPDEPAHLLDYGPLPAWLARRLVLDAGERVPRWLRRLYRHPVTGQLAAMDSSRRLFTTSQRQFLRLRDQTCRTPWCDAAIRHYDHVIPVEFGGPTSIHNGQGCCQACNHAKQAPGWRADPTDNPGEFRLTTPTGHTYRHAPPDPPGARPLPRIPPPDEVGAAAPPAA